MTGTSGPVGPTQPHQEHEHPGWTINIPVSPVSSRPIHNHVLATPQLKAYVPVHNVPDVERQVGLVVPKGFDIPVLPSRIGAVTSASLVSQRTGSSPASSNASITCASWSEAS